MRYSVVYREILGLHDTKEEAEEYIEEFMKEWEGATYAFELVVEEYGL